MDLCSVLVQARHAIADVGRRQHDLHHCPAWGSQFPSLHLAPTAGVTGFCDGLWLFELDTGIAIAHHPFGFKASDSIGQYLQRQQLGSILCSGC